MKRYGLIGKKLGHSYSKVLHSELFKLMGFDKDCYNLYEIKKEDINNLRSFIEEKQLNGINVTIPYKESVLNIADELSEEVKNIGAANTLKIMQDKITAYNTDYYGIEYMFRKSCVSVEGKSAVVLGSGGASKAVRAYLTANKAKEIFIVSRKVKKTENKTKIKYISYDELSELDADILINSTPVGMYPNIEKTPATEEIIKNYKLVVDIVYNPIRTCLIKTAQKNGIQTVGGLDMLIYQAVKAEEIWRDIKISDETIQRLKINLLKVLEL